MKTNTNTNTNQLENFQVYENGELIQAPLAIRTIQVAGNVAISALQAISRPVSRVLGECATSVQLDLFDAAHGSTMRHEYFEQKNQLAEAALRQEVGL